MYRNNKSKSHGFTLVELLIVIVVIAVLAAIVMIAYGGVQAKARDSARDSAFSQYKSALEAYKVYNGHYPIAKNPDGNVCTGGAPGGSGVCLVSRDLGAYLVPGTVSGLPAEPDSPPVSIQYVVTADGSGYALFENRYEKKPGCRYLSPDAPAGWYNGFPYC